MWCRPCAHVHLVLRQTTSCVAPAALEFESAEQSVSVKEDLVDFDRRLAKEAARLMKEMETVRKRGVTTWTELSGANTAQDNATAGRKTMQQEPPPMVDEEEEGRGGDDDFDLSDSDVTHTTKRLR